MKKRYFNACDSGQCERGRESSLFRQMHSRNELTNCVTNGSYEVCEFVAFAMAPKSMLR